MAARQLTNFDTSRFRLHHRGLLPGIGRAQVKEDE